MKRSFFVRGEEEEEEEEEEREREVQELSYLKATSGSRTGDIAGDRS